MDAIQIHKRRETLTLEAIAPFGDEGHINFKAKDAYPQSYKQIEHIEKRILSARILQLPATYTVPPCHHSQTPSYYCLITFRTNITDTVRL
jgi:hypothetical protein